MILPTHERCHQYVAILKANPPTTVPPTNPQDSHKVAMAELLCLWEPQDEWEIGPLLLIADAISEHAFSITGSDRFAIFDIQSLTLAMGNRSAACMALKLAGARHTRDGWTDENGQGGGVQVTFRPDFVSVALGETAREFAHLPQSVTPS